MLNPIIEILDLTNGELPVKDTIRALQKMPKSIVSKNRENGKYYVHFLNGGIFTKDLYDWLKLVDDKVLQIKVNKTKLTLIEKSTTHQANFKFNKELFPENGIMIDIDTIGRAI